jgi:1-acyl-sn-glycerol-3-phosphate acyltransferase
MIFDRTQSELGETMSSFLWVSEYAWISSPITKSFSQKNASGTGRKKATNNILERDRPGTWLTGAVHFSTTTPRKRSPLQLCLEPISDKDQTPPLETDKSASASRSALVHKEDTAEMRKASKARNRTTFYFAYGSNMCPRVMGPNASLFYLARRISETSWRTGEPAVLDDYVLEFNTPGARSLGEPAFANIVPVPASDSESNGEVYKHAVHGVLFRLTESEFERIMLSEGVGIAGERVISVTVQTYRKEIYHDVKTVAYISSGMQKAERPSARYLSLLMEGAQYYGLNQEYCRQLLRKAAGNDSTTSRRTMDPPMNDFIGTMRDMEVPPPIVDFYSRMHHLEGPVRFISPPMVHEDTRSQKPLLLFFPGLDGTGISIASLLRLFQSKYDARVLVIPRDNRLSLAELASSVLDQIEILYREKMLGLATESTSPVQYPPADILAESMGSILWFECVRQFGLRYQSKQETMSAKSSGNSKLARHVILVNSATNFADAALAPLWENLSFLPDPIYELAPYIFSPILIDLFQLLDDPTAAYQSLKRMGILREILPKRTLQHRVQLIRDFAYSANDFRKAALIGAERYTIIAAANDGLLPSLAESERLMRLLSGPLTEIQRSGNLIFPHLPATVIRYVAQSGGHALLQSHSFDAYRVIIRQAEEAHNRLHARLSRGISSSWLTRRTTVPIAPQGDEAEESISPSGVTAASEPTNPVTGPTELHRSARSLTFDQGISSNSVLRNRDENATTSRFLPSNRFLLGEAQQRIRQQQRIQSPVFLDFDQVPLSAQTPPVLFVGNHTRLGLIDLPFLVDHVWKTRGVFVRGLAHPIIFASQRLSQRADRIPNESRSRRTNEFAASLEALGAVPVSPRVTYNLLRRGDSLLLFPGGAREAYKRRGENNKLFWPRHEEFVRLCARLGVTIVPFASYGPDDSFDVVLDGEELLNIPLLGPFIRARAKQIGIRSDIVRAWRSPRSSQPSDEAIADLIIPLLRPRPPLRQYFQFFEPIYPDASLVDDRERAQLLYESIRDTIAEGLRRLERKVQDHDRYWQFGRRFVFEELHRGAQAPTLTPWSCAESHLQLEAI